MACRLGGKLGSSKQDSVEMAGAVCSSQRQATDGGGHHGHVIGPIIQPMLDTCLLVSATCSFAAVQLSLGRGVRDW